MALNAYGLHHLHLKPADEKGRRQGVSKDLLFVGVSRKEVLLFLLGDHDSPNDGSLHKAVLDHRAGGDQLVLKGVVKPHIPISEKESVKLLRHGVSALGTVGNRVVVGSMVSTAGTSIEHTFHADRICDMLDEYDGQLDTLEFRRKAREEWGFPLSDSAPLSWRFSYADLVLFDEARNVGCLIRPWRR